MKSAIETGHAINLANLELLISRASMMDGNYNPSNAALKIESLQALYESCKNLMDVVKSAAAAYTLAVDAREAAYAEMSRLVTRTGNALKASPASDGANQAARSHIRKIQGRTTGRNKSGNVGDGEGTTGTGAKSSSQMSFDNRLDNFGKLIEFVATVPEYNPNEKELQVAFLKTFYNELKQKNTAVITASAALNNARITRNVLMYRPKTGLVDVALGVKTYIKSVFGTGSPQYKQVASLDFQKKQS